MTKTREKTPESNSLQEKDPWLKPYRIEDGRIARVIFFVCLMMFVVFTSYAWYASWSRMINFIRNGLHLGFTVNWISASDIAKQIVKLGGAGMLLLFGTFTVYRIVFVKKKFSEFLIRTDQELYKVSWPKLKPWFKPESEVWGATYVVILTCILLTVYIYLVDQTLSFIAKMLLFS